MNHQCRPMALESMSQIAASIGRRSPAFFLDLDGTLAPIVPHPDLAKVPAKTRAVVADLAQDRVVCIVSGRDLADLRLKIDLKSVYYAADHGHRIMGPPNSGVELEVGPENRQELETAAYKLERRLRQIEGVVVETKGVSLSVHYRLVAEQDRPLVRQVVSEVADSAPGLTLAAGKLVHELRPDLSWGKGQAVVWLLKRLRLDKRDVCAICVGDDLTDEDMFAVVANWGLGVVVGDPGRPSKANYMLRDCEEVTAFLETFVVRRRPRARSR